MFFFVDEVHQELIMIEDVWILLLLLLEVRVGHHLEYEAEYCSHKLGCLWGILTDFSWVHFFLDFVHNVHFKIHKFTVN